MIQCESSGVELRVFWVTKRGCEREHYVLTGNSLVVSAMEEIFPVKDTSSGDNVLQSN